MPQTNEIVKIEFETLLLKIGPKQWKIREDGHIKTYRDQMREVIKNYEAVLQDNSKLEFDKSAAHEESTKQLLKIAVPDLDFETEANDPVIGYGLLSAAATDLYRFLAVIGGRAGMKHSLTRLGLAEQTQ